MNPGMGVCMITTRFYPQIGGAEKQIERLAGWLVAQGVPVTVVTRHIAGQPAREQRQGITIVRVPVLPGKALGMVSFVVMGTWAVIRRRRGIGIIHSHQVFSPSTIGWLAARLLRCPLIVNLHRGGPVGDLGKLLRRRRTGRLRLNLLARDAAAFIAISREIEAELLEHGIPAGKIHSLSNMVDGDHFHPVEAAAKPGLRRQLGLPSDGPLVSFVGRLVAVKGVDVLLEAWERVPPPAHLVIVGDGEQGAALRARAGQRLPGRVTFAGSRDDVAAYLQASDVWTLPSYAEGLPVSLLEAMACGLPVVVTPSGGMAEIIVDGENGLVVPAGDAGALAAALRRACDGSTRMRALGDRARQLVLDRYGVETVGRTYLALYEGLLGGGPASPVPRRRPGRAG